eukprot:6741145-Prymnesium_polylepis.1
MGVHTAPESCAEEGGYYSVRARMRAAHVCRTPAPARRGAPNERPIKSIQMPCAVMDNVGHATQVGGCIVAVRIVSTHYSAL